jgi:cyanophycinase
MPHLGRRLVLGSLLAGLAVVCLGSGGRLSVPVFYAIGGGIRDDNEQLYKALLERKDTNRIVVVPYSAGNADEGARLMIERFRKHRPDADYVVMPDSMKDAESKRLAAEMVGHADLVFFTGGDQSRLVPRFIEDGRPTSVLGNLREGMSKFATPVGGTSAGCAALSDPMFTGGGSESALADLPATDGEESHPEQRGVRLGRGLGLVDHVILDSHFLSRGRVGRMIAALEKSGKRFGVGVADNRAVRIKGSTYTAIGDAAALVVDVRELKREGLSRRGVRISLLADGDAFVPVTHPGSHNPETGTGHFGQKGAAAARIAEASLLAAEMPEVPEAWGRNAVLGMLGRLAADPGSVQVARSERFEIVISADERTRFAWRVGEPRSLGVVEAKMDVIERPAGAPESKPAAP